MKESTIVKEMKMRISDEKANLKEMVEMAAAPEARSRKQAFIFGLELALKESEHGINLLEQEKEYYRKDALFYVGMLNENGL